MAGVEERLTALEELCDSFAYFIQENLARKKRKFGLTECEEKQYIKIKDHIKSKEEEIKNTEELIK